MKIQNVVDKARYVEKVDRFTLAVWKGGHTVNFYSFHPESCEVEPTTCINVGSFEKDSATLQEVKEGIESVKEQNEF